MIINLLISKNQMTVLANKIKNITFYKINQKTMQGYIFQISVFF